jgi:DNA-directed RNA polymerase specialized sigma24 family protein
LVIATRIVAYAAALRILGGPAQAQDVVQDVFMRVWLGLARLRDECPAFAHEAA